MPEYDVELEVTYYTNAELEQMAADQAAANNVIAKINAIGTVAYTDESKALIDDARTAYDELTDERKKLVTNYTTLTDAETAYDNLKAAAEQAAAEEQFINGVELTKTGTNEWTLAAMPAFDVELEVVYCDPATGDAPTAATDVVAGSNADLVTAGSSTQGTIMYALGDNDTTAPTSGWSTDVPTADNFTEAGTANVWYYIAGNDDYSDSDPACVHVTIAAPEAPASTDIVVTAHQAITNGAYWATFYATEGNYQVPTGTEVYAITLNNGKLTMNPVADGIVNSGLAVVLKAKTGSLTMTKTETNSTFQGTSSLNGTLTEINGNANGNIYVLNTGSKGAGFYKLAENGTVPANKAYLVYDGAAGARDYFLFDETTSISEELRVKSEEIATAPVYDLQGRRVNTPTKGVYIVNGKKTVIR